MTAHTSDHNLISAMSMVMAAAAAFAMFVVMMFMIVTAAAVFVVFVVMMFMVMAAAAVFIVFMMMFMVMAAATVFVMFVMIETIGMVCSFHRNSPPIHIICLDTSIHSESVKYK